MTDMIPTHQALQRATEDKRRHEFLLAQLDHIPPALVDADEFKRRKQTHKAKLEVAEELLTWVENHPDPDAGIRIQSYIRKRRDTLRSVANSGEYPHADLPRFTEEP